ncbi:MAG: cryptochrome/photolyase family protein [Flavobacterium sp.]|uniref:cryptochrome/photolyase family protein n=1 Tax=Flavobacterium sp. TaxID=239 RepID=UPI00122A5CCB|nr:cryptochrome/photolyase family protein [Flavobacterium sp.]RZJ66486.1 MAG: cryptochrome/photolyase family protein [Flavobacterium sp.]
MKTLRLLLGDQLDINHSWFSKPNGDVIYLMAEMRQETDYVKHHIQKVVAFFVSMRNFASELKSKNHKVDYLKINSKHNSQKLEQIISDAIEKHKIEKFEYQLPDEYRLDEQLKSICKKLKIDSEAFDTEHFYTTRNEFKDFFEGKKSLLMESFYRHMRRKHDILMVGDNPRGGKWNYDHANRNKFSGQVKLPKAKLFENDVTAILSEIEKAGIKTFGNIDAKAFNWPTTRDECLCTLHHFCNHLLEHFGDYQDAMHTADKFLFHSRLSFAMNSKMISPKEVVDAVLERFHEHKDEVKINEVEGYIRQIIGWREYVRGYYWMRMPEFESENHLRNHRKLPWFYWDAKTKMNCLKHSIGQSLDEAYAHHIQRLMVIGNFALLVGSDPNEVDEWYLGVYVDAIEWVEKPNTRAMSQWADGGKIATKPYVSSGSYINKMSNYCLRCHYSVKDKFGERACPFNALYWNFVDQKRAHFQDNPRMTMMLSQLDKMKPSEREKIHRKAAELIKNADYL